MARSVLHRLALLVAISLPACSAWKQITPHPQGPQPVLVATVSPTAVQPALIFPSNSANLLPHSLYFITRLETGIHQVVRLPPDKTSLTSLTPENEDVTSFDVSSLDGTLAYVTQNRLFVSSSTGGGSILLFDGNITGQNDNLSAQVRSPRWSPDGKILAYGYSNLHIHRFDRNSITDASISLENLPANASLLPNIWSPDSKRLLVEIDYPDRGTSLVILTLENREVTYLQPGADDNRLVCCEAAWSPDSQAILVANSHILGRYTTGLWQFNAQNGERSTLIEPVSNDGTYNLAGWPVQNSSGEVTYFFASTAVLPQDEIPMSLVKSSVQTPGNRSLLRPERLSPREVLWNEDASLAVVVLPLPGQMRTEGGGPVVLIYSDGRTSRPLAANGSQVRWGP